MSFWFQLYAIKIDQLDNSYHLDYHCVAVRNLIISICGADLMGIIICYYCLCHADNIVINCVND